RSYMQRLRNSLKIKELVCRRMQKSAQECESKEDSSEHAEDREGAPMAETRWPAGPAGFPTTRSKRLTATTDCITSFPITLWWVSTIIPRTTATEMGPFTTLHRH